MFSAPTKKIKTTGLSKHERGFFPSDTRLFEISYSLLNGLLDDLTGWFPLFGDRDGDQRSEWIREGETGV